MISYAQNFEDVLLWRALKNVHEGFYIDIGAQDPVVDSVSLAFYEKGWRGLHIEPNKYYANLLRASRPGEVVKQLIVADHEGKIPFYEIYGTGLSTANSNIAQLHKSNGYEIIETIVETVSLDCILDKFSEKIVHWLKIDVEGFEKSVLDSWKNSNCRPWIILIESTKPLTQDESYSEWEPILLAKDYQFLFFDGLNRFYVHKQHKELFQYFKTPVNVFDNFALSGLSSHTFHNHLSMKAQESEAKVAEALAKETQAVAQAKVAEALAKETIKNLNYELTLTKNHLDKVHQSNHHYWLLSEEKEKTIQALINSRSWKYTAFFRWLFYKFNFIYQYNYIEKIKLIVKKILYKIFSFISTSLKSKKNKICDVLFSSHNKIIFQKSDLSPKAVKIYKKFLIINTSKKRQK